MNAPDLTYRQSCGMFTAFFSETEAGRAGPFKGRQEVTDKMAKGDMIYGLFGRATVTSCSKILSKAVSA